ncbi:hypothetical protein PaG_05432 [Moesziomyces aphidis]|uniref:MI domain-containing protein n=1 Tax=Moesziomyces aphidis TaxID=84754 RepID=W3VGC6_MOEAP|nr:hypothetical protein PaG_05432 [Moesziomyces aphidis]
MPFDPRTKSRHTTALPAALRDELGLPPPSKRSFRPHHRGGPSNASSAHSRGKPQLKAIGRPQSALNGAAKGTPRGPIKSLRNQEKEAQEQQQHHRHGKQPAPQNALKNRANEASSSSTPAPKRKPEKQPEQPLKVIKKHKSENPSQPSGSESSTAHKTRLNPFTGEMERVQPAKTKASASKQTALEKMLARAEAGPSSSKAKPKASDDAGARKKSRRSMNQQEKEEEDEIRWLEYQLGKSRQGDDVVRDDLDDFLDDLDRFQVGMYDHSDSDSQDDDEEQDESDDSGLETASEQESDSREEDEQDTDETDESEDDKEDLDDEAVYDFDSNDEDDFSNWDAAMATTDEEDADQDDEPSSDEADDDSEAEEARALISGASATADSSASPSASAPAAPSATSASSTRYIPPALRAKLAAEEAASSASSTKASQGADAEMDPVAAQKLRRQAQGLLNRLGDGNIDTIVSEYEALYRTHARAHVTATVTQLILDTITSRSNLIDTFVILHAALVAALHKVVGVEFAAYFIQRLVEDLTRHYDELKRSSDQPQAAGGEEDVQGKECLNLSVLACELYNLHVVACPLVYDLIRMFLGERPEGSPATAEGGVGEVDIELLLRTMRSCGHQLRHDDSTSLKAIIALTQARVAASPAALSTRTKFMLERMVELQKSKAKGSSAEAANPNSAAGQLLTRMKKYLGGMAKKRSVRSHEPLRISLKDLRDADKKGKWWLVGAAWTGQTDQTDAQGLTKLLPMSARSDFIQSSSTQATIDSEQSELLDLARVQGMNTDARRTVFVTLLTADDYKNAAEQVLMLKLNEVQRREIVRVLVHCVGSEGVYNPYYTLVAQEVCRNDHGMRITLQYCLWDFLRDIGQSEVGGEKFAAAGFANEDKEVDPRRIANLARAYAWWITHDCLSLQALKTVDFTQVQPRPAQFLGNLVIHMVLSIQSKSPAKTLHLPTVTRPVQQERLVKLLQANLLGGSADLARGLLLFLSTNLDARKQRHLILGHDKAAKTQLKPLLDTVNHAVRLITQTVQAIVQQQDTAGVDDSDIASDDHM